MFTPYIKKEAKRKKVNFMISNHIMVELKQWIPAGERSNFINGTLEEAIKRFKRRKACELIDELRETANIRMTTQEMIKRKNYGRP